jgi:hypothetical protein
MLLGPKEQNKKQSKDPRRNSEETKKSTKEDQSR